MVNCANGQRVVLGGRIRDGAINKDCPMAVVALLQADSTIIQFTRSRGDGTFSFFGPIPPGNYYILVTHPSSDNLYRIITIQDTTPVNLGVLQLKPRSDSLEAVIVKPRVLPPKIKGDTVEYNTSNIRMRSNAVVEEMLGRLPGLHIDADGNITYNGGRIQKLLVDGEDIFGSDPTLVTRNFDASRIAKVQLLDRKSDQATFTGIDDGNRTKTLNLVLKESSKHGYFGKVEVGADVVRNYSANGFLASFRRREQFTVLGMTSNTGSMGFNSAGGNAQASLSVLNWNNDPLGGVAGTGIPRFEATGVHYANTWNGEVDHVTGSYQFGHLLTRPLTFTQTIQTLPDTLYVQSQHSGSVNSQDQHYLNMQYDYLPDSLSAWRFTLVGDYLQGQNQFNTAGNSSFNGAPVNSNQRNIQSDVENSTAVGSLSWRTRSRHLPGRTFSLTTLLMHIGKTTNGYLYSLNRYYRPDSSLTSEDTTDQRKRLSEQTINFTGTLNYTEPLWKNASLGASYGWFYSGTNSLQGTYAKVGGKYQDYVDTLSSNFKGRTLSQNTTLVLQGKGPRFNYALGTDVLLFRYSQLNLQTDSLLHYHYTNFAPRGFVNLILSQSYNVSFEYNSSTQRPSMAQLQPIRNNSDPLHIMLGNPNLRPSFDQTFNLKFTQFKVSWLNLGLNFGTSTNNISTRTYTDSLGRQISQPINMDGARSAGLNFSFGKRVGTLDASFNTYSNYIRSISYINTDLSRNDSYTTGGGFSLTQYDPDRYKIQLTTQFNYFDTRSSVNTAVPIHYWTQAHSGALAIYLLRNFEFSMDAVYTWQEATSVFARNTSVLLWNAGVGHNFLDNQLTVRVQANNILNKNNGISRSNYANVNTETSTNILGRYCMLILTYRFDHQRKER
jgi:outer membrane receptor protein involved in Fe transport